LHGRLRSHHRFLIGQHLKTIEQLEETIAAFDARIEATLSGAAVHSISIATKQDTFALSV
ncbi:MAG: hypothetical protein WAO08_33720, partial [Hyphomicrobiaceae bacterium]